MAHVIPSDYTVLEKADMHPGEIETLKYLRTALPDEYTVFHGLHWTNERPTYNIFGETDFIIINRWGQVLVIEQKDGVLEEGDGQLIKVYGRDKRKDVVGQVLRSKENIQGKLQKLLQHHDIPSIDYLIYLPGYEVIDATAAGLHPSRVVSRSQADQLAQRICQLFSSDRRPPREHGPRVHEYFCQRLKLVPSIGSYIDAQQQSYARLSQGLSEVVEGLDMSPFRLRVIASAGAGKTQSALQFFDQAIKKEQKPLLICFNRPLADRMAAMTGRDDLVMTFYALCTDLLERAGETFDFSRTNQTGFWREVLDKVYELEITDEDRFDCAIIDEGQDFEEEWFELVRYFLVEGAPILWVEDPLQNLYGKRPIDMDSFVTYRSDCNYRTPSLIGDYVCRALDMEFEMRNPLPGLAVEVTPYQAQADLERKLAHRLNVLMSTGFSQEEIAIISCKGLNKSNLADLDQIAGIKLYKFLGYKENGQQDYPDDARLIFDTIYRFKGREKPAIIIAEIDDDLLFDERRKKLLYCAMTRATVKLDILVKEGSPWASRLVAAGQV